MGTSINQKSPTTTNWRAAKLAYVHGTIPIERAVEEIWRAATNQDIGDLSSDLAAPIIAQCLKIVEESSSREIAIANARRTIALSGQASLAADIAQRAIIHSFSGDLEKTTGFTQSLFAEAGNYLVSRDLPGYVGERAKNITEAISLKHSIKQQIANTVATVPIPMNVSSNSTSWRNYVNNVVVVLKGGTDA